MVYIQVTMSNLGYERRGTKLHPYFNPSQNYKPPSAYDIPQELNVTFIEGDKTKGMLGSKATGEPAMLSGVGVAMAIRDAVKEARKEVDPNLGWYNIGKTNVDTRKNSIYV